MNVCGLEKAPRWIGLFVILALLLDAIVLLITLGTWTTNCVRWISHRWTAYYYRNLNIYDIPVYGAEEEDTNLSAGTPCSRW